VRAERNHGGLPLQNMEYEQRKRDRKTLRLESYDYRQPGAYFLTIVAHARRSIFGEVVDENVRLGDFGRIVSEAWERSNQIRNEIALDAFIVMPNHLHGIVTIRSVRATGWSPSPSGPFKRSLGAFVAGFKSAVTTRINQLRGTPGLAVWQRNYYEHIIRNEESLNRIREYIVSNPDATVPEPADVWQMSEGDRPVAPTERTL
jgi:putative transposase